jgi:hypothetical protein
LSLLLLFVYWGGGPIYTCRLNFCPCQSQFTSKSVHEKSAFFYPNFLWKISQLLKQNIHFAKSSRRNFWLHTTGFTKTDITYTIPRVIVFLYFSVICTTITSSGTNRVTRLGDFRPFSLGSSRITEVAKILGNFLQKLLHNLM